MARVLVWGLDASAGESLSCGLFTFLFGIEILGEKRSCETKRTGTYAHVSWDEKLLGRFL